MKKHLIFYIITSLILFSCAAKKETTEKEKIYIYKTDTLKVEKEKIITQRVVDTLTIKVPCDEKGKIKDFNHKIKTAAGYVIVYSKNGEIHAELFLEATESAKENKDKSKTEIKYIDKIKTVYKTNYIERWWLWIWFFGSILYIINRIRNYFIPKLPS